MRVAVDQNAGPAAKARHRDPKLLLALAALAVIYVVVIALGDARAWSGSDAGGKVATIRYMAAHHTWVPEVGYWAADVDPRGSFHQLVQNAIIGNHYVQATTYPFVYIGVVLWRLGGYNGLLVLPVVGSLLAAYAARRLALAVGAERGWWAFWMVGVGSPMLFYAADFWEHSMAVGLALFAIALAVERGGSPKAAAAGLVAGLAGTLRNDMIVYLAVAAVVILLTKELRARWLSQPVSCLLAALLAAAPLVGARIYERTVLGRASGAPALTGRAGTSVSQAGSQMVQRLRDGVLTTVGLFPDETFRYLAVGAIIVVALLMLARRRLDIRPGGGAIGPASLVVATGAYLGRFAQGLGFVPGFIPAAPISAIGVMEGREGPRRALILTAVLAAPAIWMLEWAGDLIPQWGGRYLLLSGALLTVVAAVALEQHERIPPGRVVLVCLAVVVTGFGALWHIQRTQQVASAAAQVERVPSDTVIVSQLSDFGREAGAFYGRHRWLTILPQHHLDDVVPILVAHQVHDVEVVGIEGSSPPAVIDGFHEVAIRDVPFLGLRLRLTSLVSSGR